MIENFNGIIYLAIFIIHFIGYAVYAYRCVFATKSFLDQYGVDSTAAIMTRFFGSFFIGAVLMALYIMFVRDGGVDGTWGFFNLIFMQNLCAFIVGIYTIKINKLGHTSKNYNRRNDCTRCFNSVERNSLLRASRQNLQLN